MATLTAAVLMLLMMVMKMMVIAKDEECIVEIFESSELGGLGFILFFLHSPNPFVKTVSYMSHQRFVHIFTYQTYLQGEFSLFSAEGKQLSF